MKKTLLIYGLLLGGLLILLKSLEYRYLIRKIDTEVYLGAIALLCTTLGIWLGYQVINRRPPYHTANIASRENGTVKLSDREAEILSLMAQGLSNQEIADRLYISIHTVKTHSSNLFSKLNVKRRTQAILKAMEIGLVSS